MKKILLIIAFFNIAFAFKPTVDVTIKNSHIIPGEKVQIEIEVVAPKTSKVELPKIDSINGYKVKRKIKSSIINASEKGKVLELKDIIATYTLKPKNNLEVGPFIVMIDNKTIKTKKYKITLIKNESTIKKAKISKLKATKSNIRLYAYINKQKVFIGEQFILTYKLVRPRSLTFSHSEFKVPNFNYFNVYKLHEPKTFYKSNNIITIYQYILVPKRAGNLTLLPASFKYTLSLVPQVQASFDIFAQQNVVLKTKELVSNSVQIKVKPIPHNVDGVGIYKMRINLDKFSIEANKPLEFTLEVVGEGDLHLLNLPNMEVNNVTLFPKKPIIKKEFRNNKLFTILIQKYIYIANEDFIIPPINLRIFNPYTQKIYSLRSQAIKIKVTNTLSLNTLLKESPKEKEQKILYDINYYKKELQKYQNSYLKNILIYILGVISGVLGTIYLPILFNIIKNKGKAQNIFQNYEEAFNILYPHTTEDPQIEEMVKRLYEVINGNREIQIDNKLLNKMLKKILEKS